MCPISCAPLLFALVRSLASKIGVAAPDRIAVDCNVNCYCMFAVGIRGIFRSGFALVIGLPLVAGLRLDQVVGVLVHELAHAFEIATVKFSGPEQVIVVIPVGRPAK
jgi:hypothetical protein